MRIKILTAGIVAIMVAGAAFAGSLDAPAAPTDAGAAGNTHAASDRGMLANMNVVSDLYLVVQFDGAKKANQPGMIHVEAKAMPDIGVGTPLTLEHA